MKIITILVISMILVSPCLAFAENGLSGDDCSIIIEKAEAGDAYCQGLLAKFYDSGDRGVARDYVSAVKWAKLSAGKDHPFGLYELDLLLGSSVAQARTVAVNAIVMIEVLYLFNCRSLTQSMFRVGVYSNRWMVAGVVAMVLLQLLFTYAPFMNNLFLTAPTSPADWARVLGVSLLGYLIVELEKWVRRRKT